MMNDVFGALIFQFRTEYPDKEFDLNFFNEKVNENSFIKDLHDKFIKNGDGSSVKAQECINELVKFYTNIFNEMFGMEVKKTYTEILSETKEMVNVLKKDKTLIKLTGNKKDYLIEMILRKRAIEKVPTKIKGVVHPYKHDPYRNSRDEKVFLKPGIIEERIKMVQKPGRFGGVRTELCFTYEDVVFTSRSTEYNPSFKKLVGAYPNNREYNVDWFVDITPEEIEWMDKNRKIE